MSQWVTAYLALGANLGDREANIRSAIQSLRATPCVQVGAISRIIETEPVGPAGQGSYLNAAMEVHTTLSAAELLERCMAIEAAHGRQRSRETRWGPRTLDIDLLLYGEQIIDLPGLRVPHPHMAQRAFVLGPLAEIAPQLVHPVLKMSIQCLAAQICCARTECDSK